MLHWWQLLCCMAGSIPAVLLLLGVLCCAVGALLQLHTAQQTQPSKRLTSSSSSSSFHNCVAGELRLCSSNTAERLGRQNRSRLNTACAPAAMMAHHCRRSAVQNSPCVDIFCN